MCRSPQSLQMSKRELARSLGLDVGCAVEAIGSFAPVALVKRVRTVSQRSQVGDHH
ncbi:hypothetical protein MESS4_330067 [Mesorhizobium sp. STM 4661]|nr:hypothetical protein MESS4_330067 [Mesorhizobium sp. STM 4661]